MEVLCACVVEDVLGYAGDVDGAEGGHEGLEGAEEEGEGGVVMREGRKRVEGVDGGEDAGGVHDVVAGGEEAGGDCVGGEAVGGWGNAVGDRGLVTG